MMDHKLLLLYGQQSIFILVLNNISAAYSEPMWEQAPCSHFSLLQIIKMNPKHNSNKSNQNFDVELKIEFYAVHCDYSALRLTVSPCKYPSAS